MVGLAGILNSIHLCWTGIQMNFWPLVHPWPELSNFFVSVPMLPPLTKAPPYHTAFPLFMVASQCHLAHGWSCSTEAPR